MPTIIDIEIRACSDDRDGRTGADFRVSSNTEFQKAIVYTLGFRCRKSETRIRRAADRYISGDFLDSYQSAQMRIPPFGIVCVNLGDCVMGVHVRLSGGMERCRVTVFTPDKKPKINDDDFFKSEDIYYGTAVIGHYQTIRIEELKGDV